MLVDSRCRSAERESMLSDRQSMHIVLALACNSSATASKQIRNSAVAGAVNHVACNVALQSPRVELSALLKFSNKACNDSA